MHARTRMHACAHARGARTRMRGTTNVRMPACTQAVIAGSHQSQRALECCRYRGRAQLANQVCLERELSEHRIVLQSARWLKSRVRVRTGMRVRVRARV
jgi:hypothetical protein